MSSSTAIEPTNGTGTIAKQPTTLKGWLNSDALKGEIARALPKHCSAERMTRIATTALTRTPLLADCEVQSFVKCLLDLSQWGLEPNGYHAHLIPFRNNRRGVVECQLILDYKGIVQLLMNSGKVLSIHADVVHEGDDFAYSLGELQRHTQWELRTDAMKPREKGPMIAAYARIVMKGGAVKCEVMTKQQIDGIRARSKAKDSGPWVTDYAEMSKKSAFRRAAKWLPLSAEIIEAFDRDIDRPVATVFGGGTVIDSDFVVPPASLNQLADQRKARQEAEPMADDGEVPMEPDAEVTFPAVFGLIDAASTPTELDDIRARFVGPEATEGGFSAGEWTEIDKLIAARREQLSAKPARGQKTLVDKGHPSPD